MEVKEELDSMKDNIETGHKTAKCLATGDCDSSEEITASSSTHPTNLIQIVTYNNIHGDVYYGDGHQYNPSMMEKVRLLERLVAAESGPDCSCSTGCQFNYAGNSLASGKLSDDDCPTCECHTYGEDAGKISGMGFTGPSCEEVGNCVNGLLHAGACTNCGNYDGPFCECPTECINGTLTSYVDGGSDGCGCACDKDYGGDLCEIHMWGGF